MAYNNTNICWEEYKKSVRYTNLNSGYFTIFKIGDAITYQGRSEAEPLVIITKFTGEDHNGPIGFCYLPWRSYKQCWATPTITLRGNPRHIICYPCGNTHYGSHIDWTTVQHLDGVDHPEYIKMVKQITT